VRSSRSLALWALVSTACVRPATEVVVLLDTDAPLSRELEVRATLVAEGYDAGVARWVRGGGALDAISLPASFTARPALGLPPNHSATLVVDARLRASPDSPTELRWRRTMRFSFVPERRTMLRINLSPRCGLIVSGCTSVSAAQCTVSTLCEERGETCGDEGVCVRTAVVPQPFDGDATAPRRDGATDATLDRPAPDGSIDAQEPMDTGVVVPMDSGVSAIDTGVDAGVCTANTQSDPMNCGACGTSCPAPPNATPACAMGRCAISCVSGFAECDRNAANGCEARLDTEMNCGACGTSCSGATPVCSMGRCASGCGGSETRCGGACVNTANNTAHCGRCDNPCAARANATSTCAAGACGIACMASFGDCDGNASNGCEVNTSSTVTHCGRCGNACPAAANAAPLCSGSSCSITCNGGFANCDGNASNGCEVNTGNTVAHCGRCGNACSAAPNATPTCAGSACGIACNASFGNCDGTASNGCEVNTSNTLAHCGSCGNACPSRPGTSASCAASSCQYACNAGLADCDANPTNGCEATLGTDSHCARCNDRCTGGATCRSGMCALPIPGDSCLAPLSFSGTTVTASTCGGDSLYAGCGGAGAPDAFVRWVAPTSGFWILRINTGYQMAVTTGDCRTAVSCHGDAIGTFFMAGVPTVIGVKSSAASGCGTFTINASMS